MESTIIAYRIRNINGAETYHRARFVNGVREGWRQTQTTADLLADLGRMPWATLLAVVPA